MNCTICSAALNPGSVICGNCGAPVPGAVTSAPTPSASLNPPPVSGGPAFRAVPAANSPMAIASLALGIASWFGFGFFCSVPGVICGHMALKEIQKSGGKVGNSGMVVTGLVLGYINILISFIFFGVLLKMIGNIFG